MTDSDQQFGPRGAEFWAWATDSYDLERPEIALLEEIARTLDTLDQLDADVRERGAVVRGVNGISKANPSAIEARQQRLVMGRLIGQLALPDLDGEPTVGTLASATNRRNSHARWNARGAAGIRNPRHG